MNIRSALETISPERFEELAKELLCLDGFKNVVLHSKGSDDGIDLIADKNIQISHGREQATTWLIQCKHSSSSKPLSIDIVEKILANFLTQIRFDGLAIITNTKLTPKAYSRISDQVKINHKLIFFWDITDLEQIFNEHPFLVDKFNLNKNNIVLPGASSVRTIILSDGSVFAYHVYDTLRKYGFNLCETRIHHYGANALSTPVNELWKNFDIAIVFLAEMYWIKIPPDVIMGLRNSIERGLQVIFTPFCAWSVYAGINPLLDSILPVYVENRKIDILNLLMLEPPFAPPISNKQSLFQYDDTFIENQLTFFEASEREIFSSSWKYSRRNTFEFLKLKSGAKDIISDSIRNPVIVLRNIKGGRIAYFNMCAHNCLTPYELKSPIDGNEQLQNLLVEFVFWLAQKKPLN